MSLLPSDAGTAELRPESASGPGTAADGRQAACDAVAIPPVAINRRLTDPLALLKGVLREAPPVAGITERRVILAESPGRRETLSELFAGAGAAIAIAMRARD